MIIFTTHALIRMRERKIRKQEARKAIENPDAKRSMSDGVIIFRKNSLEIICQIVKNKIIVITIYWL